MFDWFEFDESVRKGFEEQAEQLNVYIERVIETNSHIRELPIYEKPSQQTIDKILSTGIPEEGRDSLAVGNELVKDVFEQAMLTQHPRFFSFVASAVSPYSLAGCILTDVYNLHVGGWEQAPGAGAIEENLVKWMGGLAGYTGPDVGGVFLSGAPWSPPGIPASRRRTSRRASPTCRTRRTARTRRGFGSSASGRTRS